jgi:hypothetical protein
MSTRYERVRERLAARWRTIRRRTVDPETLALLEWAAETALSPRTAPPPPVVHRPAPPPIPVTPPSARLAPAWRVEPGAPVVQVAGPFAALRATVEPSWSDTLAAVRDSTDPGFPPDPDAVRDAWAPVARPRKRAGFAGVSAPSDYLKFEV